ncbi:sialate O-acetylesterase [Poriferisphaera corsica]|nr:sialate O-acetylesterase [Poriferisphaera corsica]
MKHVTRQLFSIVFLFILLTLSTNVLAQSLKLPAIISDHMLLQRNFPCPIWGIASPNQQVTATIAGQTHTTKANSEGQWRINLNPITDKGPFKLTIKTGDKSITINDVITGENWLASGQSNMEWSVKRSNNAEQELKNAQYPDIRIFTVTKQIRHNKTFDFKGQWHSVTPDSIPNFSAVAYFFGRKLHKDLNTPVGLIHASWGGTPAQAWISYHAMKKNPRLNKFIKNYPTESKKWADVVATYEANKPQYDIINARVKNQENTEGVTKGYHKPDFDDSDWKTTRLPVKFSQLHENPDINGILWLRTTIKIPTNFRNKKIKLRLGIIDDYDMAYANGKLIGQSGTETIGVSRKRRVYMIPASINNKPNLTIAVRVLDNQRTGGFISKSNDINIQYADTKIDIAKRPWKYKFGHTFTKEIYGRFPRFLRNSTSGAYNGMIDPISPYAIKGALWYQGESNSGDAKYYQALLTSLITSWREKWDQPQNAKNFPFLIVQLTNFRSPSDKYQKHSWCELREAQRLTSLAVPNTNLAVIIDIGNAKDIHPHNKQDVGLRLAYLALADTYNKPITPAGPLFTHQTINRNNSITLHFKYADTIKPLSGDKLSGFFISSDGKKFVSANATINPDNTVTVSHPNVKKPRVVAYGYASNPQKINLTNDTNIPASPFLSSN